MARQTFEDVTEGRRRNMVANRSKDSKPEMVVRRLLHSLGYRYRLHCRDLPGHPDLVFPWRHKVIEVRGCFWHGHGCGPIGRLPKSRTNYWEPKIAGTRQRDSRNMAALRELGWEVLEVWECRLRAAPNEIGAELVKFLGPARTSLITQKESR